MFKRKSDPSDPRFRREAANALSGKMIKYVTERRDGTDEVIGRRGSMSVKDDEFILFASSEILFRAKTSDLESWELMSRDGVVLTAPDLEHGGEVRTVIAYYVYYR